MWATRAFSFVVVLFSLAAYLPASEVRTWTDTSGKTMQGKLIKVSPDGEALIVANEKLFRIPVTRFSLADQAYIKEFAENGTAPEAPAQAKNDKPKPEQKLRSDDLFDIREWTNSEGDTIRARYVRVHNGLIVLMQGKKGVQAPFDKLSVEDREFLRTHLEARGEADLLPDENTMPTSEGGSIEGGAGQPSMNFPAPSFPSPSGNGGDSGPAYVPEQSEPAYSPARTQLATAEPTGPSFPQPSFPEPEVAEPEQTGPPRHSMTPPIPPRPSLPRHEPETQQYAGPQMVYHCERCKNQLPSTIKAGDSCPHCGVFLSEEKDEHGRVVNRVKPPWYLGGINLAIIFAIVGGIARAVMRRAG